MNTRPHPRIARHWPAARHGNLSRFRLLADAVSEHRRAREEDGLPLSDRDAALHRRLDELESSLPIRSRS